MTRLISILLLSAFLFQSFSKVVILANYELNKEYIAKNFCENRNNPEMHCNGKCHMMKQMKEEDKKENGPVNNLKEKYEVQLFSEGKSAFEILNTHTVFEYSSFYQMDKTSPHLLSIFHPPAV